ncbi:MAG TPA: DoxX family protein [Flavitalea sp.]|nr:DoxX family protein [Flavitalea sp.]
MKRFFSTRYSTAAFNIAMLILRVGMGILIVPHGYDKLMHFTRYKKDFLNFMGMGSTTSLALVVFAEFICGGLVVLGLFTRFAVIPLMIAMFVALFIAHNGAIFGDGEHATLFFCGFVTLLLVGPGRISIDGMISK